MKANEKVAGVGGGGEGEEARKVWRFSGSDYAANAALRSAEEKRMEARRAKIVHDP